MPGRMTRRNFVRGVTVTGTAAAALVAAEGTRAVLEGSYGVPVTGQVVADAAHEGSWIKTTCAMCTCGCGLEVRVVDGRAVKIEGNPLHPVNQGVCCLKGHAALETLYSPERLRHPRVQGQGRGRRLEGDLVGRGAGPCGGQAWRSASRRSRCTRWPSSTASCAARCAPSWGVSPRPTAPPM